MATKAMQVHVEAIQTVTPAKASDPGRSRRISAAVPLAGELLRSHHRLVAYYRRMPVGEDRGAADNIAGRLKESLNAALGERQAFAGRIREGDGVGTFEVRFNDAGLRLVQARAEVGLAEFMEMEGRDEREGLLAYWSDVDAAKKHFSALCYVQVTSFEGGGYSIGASCSVLVADTVTLVDFFKSWARVHTAMLAESSFSKFPLFRLPKTRRPGATFPLESAPLGHALAPPARTVVFDLPLAAAATAAARGRFYVIEGGEEEVRVELLHRRRSEEDGNSGLGTAARDVVSVEEVAFGEGNAPMHVSYRVQSDGGLVLVSSSPADRPALIAVTVPTPEAQTTLTEGGAP